MLIRLRIRAKLLLLLFLANLTMASAFSASDYYTTRAAIIEGINNDLESTAYGAYHIFPEDYHDIEGRDAISEEDFMRFHDILSRYARETKTKYIYSMIKSGADIRFVFQSDETDIFSIYDTAPKALDQVFTDGMSRFEDYTDKYGTFRSLFKAFETRSGRRYVIGVDVPSEFMNERLSTALVQALLIGAGIFMIFFFIEFVIITRLVTPLKKLTVSTKMLAEQDFSWSEEIQDTVSSICRLNRDEVGELAGALSFMHSTLEEYIVMLKKTTAEKERTEKELAIAREIQMGILPQTFPAFPGHEEFDLHAIIKPARLVGGDLYDYILLDDDRLFFVIGDVSDKGIAAALFMAITKTLFRTHVLSRNFEALSDLVTMINTQLSRNNPSLMFVTLFAGILNLKTGEIEYVDAGHEPPFILRSESGVEMVRKEEGLAICFDENYSYTSYTLQLKRGDGIVLYTDGLTDARNENGERLHLEGNLKILQNYVAAASPESINKGLLKSLNDFVGEAEQFDDIALLTIRYHG